MRLFKKNPSTKGAQESSSGKEGHTEHHGKRSKLAGSWWQHRRTFAIISLTVIVIILIAIVPIIVVQQLQHQHASHHATPTPTSSPTSSGHGDTNRSNGTSSNNSTESHRPNPYDDSAQANSHVPALTQDFHYIKQPVRGINLGGWLVLEPFITPGIFEQAPDTTKSPKERYDTSDRVAVDEWTLCKRLGPTKAKQVLEHHYDTFIKEDDFKRIREMGFNHVRIPIGHWSIRPSDHEPFVPYVSWKYLIRGIQWARKYGLRVMVELHTAPGSQNGWNHSGRAGEIRWLNGENGDRYANETMQVVKAIATFFNTNPKDANEEVISTNTTESNVTTSQNKWSHVVPIIGVLNEPAMMEIKDEPVKQWYRDSEAAIRKITGHKKGPILSYHDGFLGLSPWKNFFKNFDRAFLETHMYLIFDPNLVYMEREKQAAFPCNTWRSMLADANKGIAPTMVGEFSFATNDCGKYLNGVGMGTRYENTMDGGGVSECDDCNCTKIEDWRSWKPSYQHFLNTFVQHQMDAYEAGVGWFFWTYKTEKHINPHWDYLLAWEKGWAPKDVNNRNFSCDKL